MICKAFFSRNNHYIFNLSNPKIYVYRLLLKIVTKNECSFYVHNTRLINEWKHYNYLVKLSFKKATSKIVVSNNVRDFLIKMGIDSSKITVKHAFLPPPLEDEKKILKNYPIALLNFIGSHKPLIIANAFRMFFYNGVNVYGYVY